MPRGARPGRRGAQQEALGCPARTVTPRAGVPSRRVTPPPPAPARAVRLGAPHAVPDSSWVAAAEPMEPARGAPRGDGGGEALLAELEALVRDVERASSWWERHGVDCAILALSLLSLPAGEGHGTGRQGAGLRLRRGPRARTVAREMGTPGDRGLGEMCVLRGP